jgi:BirA family biotin operon repressor/biotin-[acetyl-CoA-carboxylase] ligase
MSSASCSQETLDTEKIKFAIGPVNLPSLGELHLFNSISSTNTYLLHCAKSGMPTGSVCFAEEQTEGRGRQGRVWFSPRGANIYCSLLWYFPESNFSALSLAIGIAVISAIKKLGMDAKLQLKWPNDVLCEGRKLAGILLESLPPKKGKVAVVIGVGLNVCLPVDGEQKPEWIDLQEVTQKPIERNKLAGFLVDEILSVLKIFTECGFSAFVKEWREVDALLGREVQINTGKEIILGAIEGVNAHGELLLKRFNGDVINFQCGEVSVLAKAP